MRNLFGQVDGTIQPDVRGLDAKLVWNVGEPAWLADGSALVLRRIAMNLDTWDKLDRSGREQSVGRTLHNGAPLTGVNEHDEPDFAATTAIGFPVIPEFSHVRRSRPDDTSQRIFRRAYNYDERPAGADVSDAGLVFVSVQADIDAPFTPIQRRLDELDLLNEWLSGAGHLPADWADAYVAKN